MLFPPIAMLYRHFLELSMKSVIQDGMELDILETKDVAEYEHRLHDLWVDARKVIEHLNGSRDPTPVRSG